MSEYNKEDIKNLHYNNNNEIQYEYSGQIYHCSMEHLKEVLVTCWNLQQENQQLKEELKNASNNYTKYIQERDKVIEEVREKVVELKKRFKQEEHQGTAYDDDLEYEELLQILDKVKKGD